MTETWLIMHCVSSDTHRHEIHTKIATLLLLSVTTSISVSCIPHHQHYAWGGNVSSYGSKKHTQKYRASTYQSLQSVGLCQCFDSTKVQEPGMKSHFTSSGKWNYKSWVYSPLEGETTTRAIPITRKAVNFVVFRLTKTTRPGHHDSYNDNI